jgi:hypothetical protein
MLPRWEIIKPRPDHRPLFVDLTLIETAKVNLLRHRSHGKPEAAVRGRNNGTSL